MYPSDSLWKNGDHKKLGVLEVLKAVPILADDGSKVASDKENKHPPSETHLSEGEQNKEIGSMLVSSYCKKLSQT